MLSNDERLYSILYLATQRVHPHIAVSDVRTLRDLPDKLLYPRADVVFV